MELKHYRNGRWYKVRPTAATAKGVHDLLRRALKAQLRNARANLQTLRSVNNHCATENRELRHRCSCQATTIAALLEFKKAVAEMMDLKVHDDDQKVLKKLRRNVL